MQYFKLSFKKFYKIVLIAPTPDFTHNLLCKKVLSEPTLRMVQVLYPEEILNEVDSYVTHHLKSEHQYTRLG